jgi:hypothetical protein
MTKNKAIEILDNEYDECIKYREIPYVDIDEVNDLLIALLTAMDALKEKCDTVK